MDLRCSANRPGSSTEPRDSDWNDRNFHPINVCYHITENFNTCNTSDQSYIVVDILIDDGGLRPRLRIPKPLVNNQHRIHCETINPCKLAKAVEGRNIAGSAISVSAYVWGNSIPNEPIATFHSSFSIAAYSVVKLGDMIPVPNHKLNSVLCNLPNCQIVPKSSKLPRPNIYRLSITSNQTVTCESGDGPWSNGMITITSFECDGPCPVFTSRIRKPS